MVLKMPTYEYECRSCRHRFERFQPITSKPVSPCPQCGKAAKRLISSGAGVLFKGSGFYATDYRSPGYKKRASEESKKPVSGSGGCSAKPASDK